MTEQLTPVYPERFLRRACQNGALVSPSISPFRLSTADSQPFSSNSLSFTLLSKNAPANHLESHSCKNKGLKVPCFHTLTKNIGGGVRVIGTRQDKSRYACSGSYFRLSTVDCQLSALSPLTSTLTKNVSATPLTSTLTKTKDLKSFNINTYEKG